MELFFDCASKTNDVNEDGKEFREGEDPLRREYQNLLGSELREQGGG